MPGTVANLMLPTDYAPTKADIFDPAAWPATQEYVHVGLTSGCMAEVCCVIDGTYMAAGVPASLVPGDTLQKKIQYVISTDGAKWFAGQVARKDEYSGFVFIHDEPYTCLVLPRNHIVVVIGMHKATMPAASPSCKKSARTEGAKQVDSPLGLRWNYMDITSRSYVESVIQNIENVLATYPALARGAFPKLKEALEKYILVACSKA